MRQDRRESKTRKRRWSPRQSNRWRTGAEEAAAEDSGLCQASVWGRTARE